MSIPVQFVGSGRGGSESDSSALKIQKVFRGFLVRKSVKKIAVIKREVNEVERQISREEALESMREVYGFTINQKQKPQFFLNPNPTAKHPYQSTNHKTQ